MTRQAHDKSVAEIIERSRDPLLLNDLAAAHYARAQTESRADDLMIAMAASARAHQLAPKSEAAAWNHALCLSALGLGKEASDAWQVYLRLDPASEWGNEARERHAELQWQSDADRWSNRLSELGRALERGDTALITLTGKTFPVRMKALAERDWIAMWATAIVQRDAAAPRLLTAIDEAGRGIASAVHDRQLLDFVAAVHATRDVIALAQAHVDLGKIQIALRESGTAEAIVVAERCYTGLLRVHSPVASVVAVNLGALYYYASQHTRALEALDRADATIDVSQWRLLAARSAWNRGVALTSLGDVHRAAAAYARTIELYRGDPTHKGMLQMLLGDNAELARNMDDAWTYYVEAIRLVERHGEPERVLVVLDSFARSALRHDHLGMARILADAVTARATASAYTPFVCHALTIRCEIENRVGDRLAAATACDAARQIWSSIKDSAVRDRLEGDLEIASAAIADRGARIDSLTRAVDVSERRGDLFRLSRVLLLRARAYTEEGAAKLAIADLEHALVSVEEQRQRLVEISDKITYFETARAIADELVRWHVRRGDYHRALNVVEAVRARALIDRMSAVPPTAPLSVDTVRSALAPRQAVLEYWADQQELFVWIIRREGVTFVRGDSDRRAIAESAEEVVTALTSGRPAENATATLTAQVFNWVAHAIEGIETLTVVPDDVLSAVPFAALKGIDGRAVIETFAINTTPSASALALAQALPERRASILILANPVTSPPLPTLDVRDEIAAAVRAVPDADVREGREATARAVQVSARNYDVLHIASHGFDATAGGEAAMALAPDGDDEGLLTASDVERATLRKGTLVVLAGCRTMRGRPTSDGPMSMARAFTAAGARSVVASMWDVEDAASNRLLTAFYSALAEGVTPTAALRSAQLSMIHDGHPASAWAAYQLFGGR